MLVTGERFPGPRPGSWVPWFSNRTCGTLHGMSVVVFLRDLKHGMQRDYNGVQVTKNRTQINRHWPDGPWSSKFVMHHVLGEVIFYRDTCL